MLGSWLVVVTLALEIAALDTHAMRGSFATLTADAVLQYLRDHGVHGDEKDLEEAATLASQARDRQYAKSVPDDIFMQYVAPPQMLDEPLTRGTREKLRSYVEPILEKAQPKTVSGAAEAVMNELGPSLKLRFLSNMTPQILSSEQVLENKGGSCTGLSVFFVDALRSAGIPARVAGTPYWQGNHSAGNHNWVEVYTGSDCAHAPCEEWSFLEAPWDGNLTAGALQRPCKNWFCNAENLGAHSGTQTYATHLLDTGVTFPLAWNTSDTSVFAEKRNDYYARVCERCTTS
jgi:hypothetical protein